MVTPAFVLKSKFLIMRSVIFFAFFFMISSFSFSQEYIKDQDYFKQFIKLQYQDGILDFFPNIEGLQQEITTGKKSKILFQILEKKLRERFTDEEMKLLVEFKTSEIGQKEQVVNFRLLPEVIDSVYSITSDVYYDKNLVKESLQLSNEYIDLFNTYLELSQSTDLNEIEFMKGFTSGFLLDSLSNKTNVIPIEDSLVYAFNMAILLEFYANHFSLNEFKKLVSYYSKEPIKKLRRLEFSIQMEAIMEFAEVYYGDYDDKKNTDEKSSLDIKDINLNPVFKRVHKSCVDINTWVQGENPCSKKKISIA